MDTRPNLLVVTGLHRGRNTRSNEEDDAQIHQYLNWNDFNPNDALRRFDVVDQHISTLREADVTNYGVGDDLQKVQVRDTQINALLDKANEKIENEINYGKLLWAFAFAVFYVIMLVVQKYPFCAVAKCAKIPHRKETRSHKFDWV